MLLVMKVWLLVILVRIAFMRGNGEDYNKEEHALLCDVLGEAVKIWGTNGKMVKGQKVKKALMQTIFGDNEREEDPRSLNLPREYESNGGSNPNDDRLQWCGACDKRHFPGESATHDLLCLCTPGPDGVAESDKNALCGRKTGGSRESHMGFGPSTESVKKTWEEIVKYCLRKGVNQGLRRSLEEFKKKVEGNKNKLGGAREVDNTICGGNALNNTCVNYAADGRGAEYICIGKQPWWKILYEAIIDEPQWEEIETPPKARKENVQTTKPSRNTAELPKAEKITTTRKTTSPKSKTLIYRTQWLLLVLLLN